MAYGRLLVDKAKNLFLGKNDDDRYDYDDDYEYEDEEEYEAEPTTSSTSSSSIRCI